MLITAVIVRIKLGSPVLFVQDRPGKDGKIFKLHKFRTMTVIFDTVKTVLRREGINLDSSATMEEFMRWNWIPVCRLSRVRA